MLMFYLGGILPCLLSFLVIAQGFARTRHDALVLVASCFLVSVFWPFVCAYLIYYLYHNRR